MWHAIYKFIIVIYQLLLVLLLILLLNYIYIYIYIYIYMYIENNTIRTFHFLDLNEIEL